MVTLQVISILFMAVGALLLVALVFYFVRKIKPVPPPSKHVRHVSLSDLPGVDVPEPEPEKKETPPTSQINIPPVLSPSHQNYSPMSLSGMGSSWKPVRKLTPKRYRRFPPKTES